MKIQEIYTVLDRIPGRNIKLDNQQKEIIEFGKGPLWIIAGPGSGKTEVLVLRCLKLMCVDGLDPRSIIITTFTNKAAHNIEDRLACYIDHLSMVDVSIKKIDISQLRVGTLHSVCNDIMQEYRYEDYKDYRLLDEIEQPMFIYEHSIFSRVKSNSPEYDDHFALWKHFDYLVDIWTAKSIYMPNKWKRVKASITLLNRIVEDRIDVERLRKEGGVYKTLADAYDQYVEQLELHYRCDFSHMQKKFLGFLESPKGRLFLNGDKTNDHPGIKYVLVDEYQDTNPIQEAIYLKLGEPENHNLCIVGDDDQALYRFRGGTVECMVTFDKACSKAWNIPVKDIAKKPLSQNYRSHPKIVEWCNQYIKSFNEMNKNGARVSDKLELNSKSTIIGNYPSVGYRTAKKRKELANLFAETVKGLLDNKIISDPNQCVLLLPTVREGPKQAGPFVEALESQGLKKYNPRSGAILKQEEVKAALGAFISILDPKKEIQNEIAQYERFVPPVVEGWRKEYQRIAKTNPDLREYVNKSVEVIQNLPSNKYLEASFMDIFYHILNYPPFVDWQENPNEIERAARLGVITQVLERYVVTPWDKVGSDRRYLKTSSREEAKGRLSVKLIGKLYYLLFGVLVSGKLDEPEDDEVICPSGRVPIMTVHQAKGLEFPFVFVGDLAGNSGSEWRMKTPKIEEELSRFRIKQPLVKFSLEDRSMQDLVRFYFVAYSRAQYALILLLEHDELDDATLGLGGKGKSWFKSTVGVL